MEVLPHDIQQLNLMKKPKLGLPPTPPASLSQTAMQAMQEMINKSGSVLEALPVESSNSKPEEDKFHAVELRGGNDGKYFFAAFGLSRFRSR